MDWLVGLPASVLALGWLVVMFAVAAVSRLALRAFVPAGEDAEVAAVAAPLMPGLGATFAVLMALTLAGEAASYRSAEDIVTTEAAQSSRLAWSATSAGVDTAAVQGALEDYLRSIRADEWHGGIATQRGSPTTSAKIADLERIVRAQVAKPATGTPVGTELLAALDGVISTRRERLAAASREFPWLYVLTLVASGVVLMANAGALAFRSSLRTSLLVLGLAAVVAWSLALLFALTAPWDGALVVSGQPIDSVIRDLQRGFFHS